MYYRMTGLILIWVLFGSLLQSCKDKPPTITYIRTVCTVPRSNAEAFVQAKLKAHSEIRQQVLTSLSAMGPKDTRVQAEDVDDQISQMRYMIINQEELVDQALQMQFCVDNDIFNINPIGLFDPHYNVETNDMRDSTQLAYYRELKRQQMLGTR